MANLDAGTCKDLETNGWSNNWAVERWSRLSAKMPTFSECAKIPLSESRCFRNETMVRF
jgi:hypothetical protein